MPLARSQGVRPLVFLAGLALFAFGCTNAADDAVTGDDAEIVEGRSMIERELSPPIAAPKTTLIGRKTSDVLAEVTEGLSSPKSKSLGDGCTLQTYADPQTKHPAVERQQCKRSEIIRVLADDGTVQAEHSDLDKDGTIDQWAGEEGALVKVSDANFDGKVDSIVERVDRVKDFSLQGYDEAFPKSRFVYRVREDRNRDGKLDYEKLLAKSPLPAAQ